MIRRGIGVQSYVAVLPPVLDIYPSAYAAYSIRKLRKNYTGSCLRVRRSTDNAETDIGFVGDDFDSSSLLTFCGAGNGFVTTWYDQSGNSRNSTQTTAINQPQIVSSGSLLQRNNKLSLQFDGSNDCLIANSTSGITIGPTTYYSVSSRNNTSVVNRAIFATGILSGDSGYGTFYDTSDLIKSQVRYNISNISTSSGYSNVLQKINLMLSTTNTTFLNTWYNAGATDLVTHSYANSTTTRNLCIGARIDSIAPGFHLNGSVSEVIVWQLDYTSTKSGIESNVKSYFNI
jgi:hypothetical protein